VHSAFPMLSDSPRPLRYGENPEQRGVFVPIASDDPLGLSRFEQRLGPELSYTNVLDADAALSCVCAIAGGRRACAVVKHAIPCGAAVGDDPLVVFRLAWDGDALAAFGSFVALTYPVDEGLAAVLLEDGRVVRGLLAPAVTDAALLRLGKRKNLRVLVNPALETPTVARGWEWRTVRGAWLGQEVADGRLADAEVEVVSRRGPTPAEWIDLRFAWAVVCTTRSNAVVIVRSEQLVGSGAGQQDRLRPAHLAVDKAAARAIGAVAASDGFFPFIRGDAPEVLLAAGISALVQPFGGRNDADLVALCDERDVALLRTRNRRGFRH
jgi:phosphoribosylaminoimidazolecarboxamide formyltransferase / IMP cyclohydrolase